MQARQRKEDRNIIRFLLKSMQRNIRMKWLCTLDSSGIHLFMRTSNAQLGFEDLFPSKWSWLLITRNTTHAQDLWRKNFSVDSAVFHRQICSVQLSLNWTFAWRYNVMTIKLKKCCRPSIERSQSPMRSLSGVFCELETLTWAWERHWSNVGQQ